jgi:DNA-binding response OmpR family regulator
MNFRVRGYEVITAADGEQGMAKAFEIKPDLIILDIGLPGFSGLDILEELRGREETVPVLILSARGKVSQRVEGLKLGADDYLAKPFELSELVARVEALLRRFQRARAERDAGLRFGALVIDVRGRKVLLKDEEVALSAKEFELLRLLAGNPGKTFSRETILERVWGWDFEGTPRTVDNFVLSLRRKLEADPDSAGRIVTVRQAGYRFDP